MVRLSDRRPIFIPRQCQHLIPISCLYNYNISYIHLHPVRDTLTMASFDDPNFFTNSIFTYDQTHLAPSQDYLSQQRHSISCTSDIFASLSPSASSSSNGFPAPPSLNHTVGSSSQSPRSSASPHSNGFYENSVSDFELDELLNMSSEAYEQKPQYVNGQLHMQPQNLFLPNFGTNFGTMGGAMDFGKVQADQLANMLLQQQPTQNFQQQTMAPQWMQNQQDMSRQQGQYSQPQNSMSLRALTWLRLTSSV